MELRDRVAVVTGAASGIGEAVARRFRQEGARHVVVADLDGARARDVAASIGGTAAELDVGDEAAVAELVATTEREHGAVDVFFSNAGYVTVGGLEAPVEDLDRMWRVHVLAHLFAARAVIPGMVERGEGYVLSTASAAGLLTQFASLHYAITKRAAIALAEWVAITHGHQGIHVSVLCPQAVATRIEENSPNAGEEAEAGFDAGVASADGVMQPEEVAACCVEAMREERFHILPHAEVGEYVRRKAEDVDRWIGGMQRWQGSLFPAQAHPALRFTGVDPQKQG